MKRSLFAFIALFAVSLSAAVAPDLADRVDVIIGTTGPQGRVNYGGVCPWVSPPFAMTQWMPMTQENEISKLPYRHEQRNLAGFMGTHQPTVWMSDYGFITIMPQIGEPQVLFKERGVPMKDGTEDARAYYYSIQTGKKEADTIRTEIAATSRCSMFRFSYPDTDAAHLFVEISRVPGYEGWLKISDDGREITGYNPGRHNDFRGRPMGPALEKFKGYYVIQFETPFNPASAQTWKATGEPGKQKAEFFPNKEIKGERAGAVVTFGAHNGMPVKVRIGSSFISLEQASENLRREIPDWDFDRVVRQTKQEWNNALSRVIAEGGTDDEQVLFYTSMYHTLMFPRRFDEYGKYYSPFDEKIHKGVSYNDYSLWDTFRALHPLLTLTAPEHVSPMVQSLVQMYEEGGWMPKWPNPTYTNIMIGTPADSVVADAYMKGFRDFDVKKAYEAIYKNAMTPPDGDANKRWADRAAWTSYEARAGLTYYKELGYVPADKTNESVSNTLEYAYEDYCVAQMAKGLGKQKDYEFFMQRSKNYRNLYNPKTGFMQPRLADGTFFEGDPKKYSSFTEGSPWTYLFCAMHDVPGLLELMGRDMFVSRLDENFSGGHFAFDNEPENHYPYLYTWVGQPEKTQRIVTDVLTKYFRTTPDGMAGNDDCGQMSALYVFTALGFYPVAPASNEYVIGRPFFKRSTINITFPKKATFTVLAHNLSSENIYVKSVKLNGKQFDGFLLKHEDIVKGGVLEFEMSKAPREEVLWK